MRRQDLSPAGDLRQHGDSGVLRVSRCGSVFAWAQDGRRTPNAGDCPQLGHASLHTTTVHLLYIAPVELVEKVRTRSCIL